MSSQADSSSSDAGDARLQTSPVRVPQLQTLAAIDFLKGLQPGECEALAETFAAAFKERGYTVRSREEEHTLREFAALADVNAVNGFGRNGMPPSFEDAGIWYSAPFMQQRRQALVPLPHDHAVRFLRRAQHANTDGSTDMFEHIDASSLTGRIDANLLTGLGDLGSYSAAILYVPRRGTSTAPLHERSEECTYITDMLDRMHIPWAFVHDNGRAAVVAFLKVAGWV